MPSKRNIFPLFILTGSLVYCAVIWSGEVLPTVSEPEAERPRDFTGTWITKHENDEKDFEGEFQGGKAHGRHRIWDSDGNLLRAGWNYRGLRHGAWSFWNRSGRLRFVELFANGRSARTIHYSGLEIIADGEYKNSNRWNGTFFAWDLSSSDEPVIQELRNGRAWNGKFLTPLPSSIESAIGNFGRRKHPTKLVTVRDGRLIHS